MQQNVWFADEVADELGQELCSIIFDVFDQVHTLSIFKQTIHTNLHSIMKRSLTRLRIKLQSVPGRFFQWIEDHELKLLSHKFN